MEDPGRLGRLGLGPPQANPTVEPEFRALAPEEVALHTVRLVSTSPDPRTRLIDYIEELTATLERYDTLRLDAFAFACTASTYLVGDERERVLVDEAERALGCPVVTAARAIHAALREHGARRIAVIAPYPEWLAEAGRSYWQRAGYEVATLERITLGTSDTRAIYELGNDDAWQALERIAALDVDAFVFTGTGMPSLAAIERARDVIERPVLSSNSCLAAAALTALGSGVRG